MISQKQNVSSNLTNVDRWLITGGLFSITLLAWYLAQVLLNGHPIMLLMEGIVYLAVLVVYALTLRKPSQSLILLSRLVSFSGIIAAALVAAFIVYFSLTFKW